VNDATARFGTTHVASVQGNGATTATVAEVIDTTYTAIASPPAHSTSLPAGVLKVKFIPACIPTVDTKVMFCVPGTRVIGPSTTNVFGDNWLSNHSYFWFVPGAYPDQFARSVSIIDLFSLRRSLKDSSTCLTRRSELKSIVWIIGVI
jgi:hypothetical protein